jgi:TrmH family RNA methyltransferase
VYKEITSIQNPLIKEILQLQEKSRMRKKLGLCIVEGKREITLAQKADYQIEILLYTDYIFDENSLDSFNLEKKNIILVSKEVYQKIAFRNTTEGVIAIIKTKELSLDQISINTKNPLIMVAEAPEKPGNIGALLRTADAAHIDAVLIANPKTDMFNPNVIRSSVGCIFTNQIATGSTRDIISFLKKHHIDIYCAALTASKLYHTISYKESSAIVVGTEATGLSKEWLENSTQNIIIPMQGEIDSLNVSVSAAIVIFEAKRQRNFK